MALPVVVTSWLVFGLVLMLMEIITPGFVIFFFGLSAMTVALILWLFPSLSLSWALLLFSLFSILYLLLLRRFFKCAFRGDREVAVTSEHELVGKIGVVLEEIHPPCPGRVTIGETSWQATATVPLQKGMMVRVIGQENLTVQVALVDAGV